MGAESYHKPTFERIAAKSLEEPKVINAADRSKGGLVQKAAVEHGCQFYVLPLINYGLKQKGSLDLRQRERHRNPIISGDG